jgi:hypothetical protein
VQQKQRAQEKYRIPFRFGSFRVDFFSLYFLLRRVIYVYSFGLSINFIFFMIKSDGRAAAKKTQKKHKKWRQRFSPLLMMKNVCSGWFVGCTERRERRAARTPWMGGLESVRSTFVRNIFKDQLYTQNKINSYYTSLRTQLEGRLPSPLPFPHTHTHTHAPTCHSSSNKH